MILFFWIRTAGRFLLRSGKMTFVLSLMLFSAISALIFLSSLAVGVNDAMIRNTVRLFSGHITGADLPAALPEKDLLLPGVRQVLKRVAHPGRIQSSGGSESVTVIGVDPTAEKQASALWRKTVAGRYPEVGEAALFLGKPLALRLQVAPGDRITLVSPGADPLTFMVCGLFETGIYEIDGMLAFCPESVFPEGDRSWEAAIFLEDGVQASGIVKALTERFPEMYRFTSWEDLMPDLSQLIDLNYLSMTIVILLVFCVVSLGIACGLIIFILKNLREYAILKAMGATSGEITGLIYAKVILLNLAAVLAGGLAGAVSVWIVGKVGIDLSAFTSHNRYFAVSGVIYPRLTWFSLGMPPFTAGLFSLVAPLWPALFILRRKTAEILRSV